MFTVLKVTSVPDHIQGYISRFLVEVEAGLYVGVVSPKVADNLWDKIQQSPRSQHATMILSDPKREQGYSIRTYGDSRREVRDFEGLLLIAERIKS